MHQRPCISGRTIGMIQAWHGTGWEQRRGYTVPTGVAEMQIVLGSLLAQHRFGLAEDIPVTPMPRTFTIGPKGGVRMIYHGPATAQPGGGLEPPR